MLKTFVRDSAIYGMLRILTSGMGVLLLPLYTRLLRPAEYGVVDLVTISSAILTTIVTVEIAQGMARYYASAQSPEERAGYASTTFWFTAGAFSLVVAAVSIAAPQLSRLVASDERFATAIRIASLAVAGQAMLYVVLTALRYALRPWSYAVGSLVFSAASISGAVLFVRTFRMGVEGVFLAQATACALALAVALFLSHGDVGFHFDFPRCRQMLSFSAPLVLSSIGVLSAAYADRFSVRSVLTIAALGVYAVGARLASAVAVAINAFQTALSPLIYRHHAEPGAPRQIERIFRWFVAGTTTVVVFVGAFAGELTRILAGADYQSAAAIVFFLALASVLSNLYLFAPGLWIANRTSTIAMLNITFAVCSFTLNLLVVPRFGIRGAAIVSCVVAFCGFTVQLRLAQRFYHVPYHWPGMIGAAVLLVLFALVVSPLGALPSGALGLVGRAAIFLFFSGGLVLILVGREELRILLASVKELRLKAASNKPVGLSE